MSEISIETVGVIGLGKMGGPLARHLAHAGFSVLGYAMAGARMWRSSASGSMPKSSAQSSPTTACWPARGRS